MYITKNIPNSSGSNTSGNTTSTTPPPAPSKPRGGMVINTSSFPPPPPPPAPPPPIFRLPNGTIDNAVANIEDTSVKVPVKETAPEKRIDWNSIIFKGIGISLLLTAVGLFLPKYKKYGYYSLKACAVGIVLYVTYSIIINIKK